MNILLMLIVLLASVFMGLLIRLKLEGIPNKKIIQALYLSINYLIVYPFILFPHIVNMCKKDIAEFLWDNYLKQHRGCVRSRKAMIEKVSQSMDRKVIMKMWGSFLKDILQDYGTYTDKNIKAVKEIIYENKIATNKVKATYVDNNQIQIQPCDNFGLAY